MTTEKAQTITKTGSKGKAFTTLLNLHNIYLLVTLSLNIVYDFIKTVFTSLFLKTTIEEKKPFPLEPPMKRMHFKTCFCYNILSKTI